jgi:hypothetical protein
MSTRVADIRDVVLTTLSVIASAALIPVLPFVGMPAAGLALAWLQYRVGRTAQIAVALVAAATATAAYYSVDHEVLVAVLVAPVLVAAGPLAVTLLRRVTALRAVAVLTAIVLAAMLAFEVAQAASDGLTLQGKLRRDAELSRRLVLELVRGRTAAEVQRFRVAAAEASRQTLRQWPSTIAFIAGLAALLDVVAVGWIARRAGARVASLPPLSRVDVSGHFIWPVIAGLAALAFATWSASPEGTVGTVGLNLLLLVRPVMFLQGAGAITALYERAGVGRFGRAVGFALLVGIEALAPVPTVSALGTADLFVNLRKLPRDGTLPPA